MLLAVLPDDLVRLILKTVFENVRHFGQIIIKNVNKIGYEIYAEEYVVNSKINDMTLSYVIKEGYMNILEWFHHGFGLLSNLIDNSSLTHDAVIYNHFDILQWLASVGCEVSHGCITASAKSGNLEVVVWYTGNKYSMNIHAANLAAKAGYLDILIILAENDYSIWNHYLDKGVCPPHVFEWLNANYEKGLHRVMVKRIL